MTLRLRRLDDVTVAVGSLAAPEAGAAAAVEGPARTMRSTCSPDSAPGAVVTRCVPALSARSDAPHGVAVTASPASSAGTGGLDPHGQGLAVDADQVVTAAGVELRGDGGRRAERQLGDGGGERTGSPYRRSMVDRGSMVVI